jgi:hypothetical protein
VECTRGKARHIKVSEVDGLVKRMREKLLTEEGKERYKKRLSTVEPVLGNLKKNLGYRDFLLRGIEKVKGEFNLMCIAHNLKKIHKHLISAEGGKSSAMMKRNYERSLSFLTSFKERVAEKIKNILFKPIISISSLLEAELAAI